MSASFPVARPRRLRRTPALRALVAETSLRPRELVLPVFIKEGISEPQPIGSMPGVVQHTRDSLRKAAAEAAEAGVGGLIVFGIPAVKDGRGSAADDPAGISSSPWPTCAPRSATTASSWPTCACDEYTDHGHCGLLTAGRRRRQRRHPRAVRRDRGRPGGGGRARGRAERDDGRPGRRRSGRRWTRPAHGDVGDLRLLGQVRVRLLRPVPRGRRVRARSSATGPAYQQDPANAAEALREVALDIAEGADMVMVKPALAYLDVIRRVARLGRPCRWRPTRSAASTRWSRRRRPTAGWTGTGSSPRRSPRSAGRAPSVILTYWAAEVAGG